ncbi:uncharacterized protein LOC123320698 isoform X2 [Coccinella septempunctata]|nr:uncharacterized protein LOC123320698 isoform X2 [Coccinella septempunctata]
MESESSNNMAVSGIEKGKESEEMMEDDTNSQEQNSSLDIPLITDTPTNISFSDAPDNTLSHTATNPLTFDTEPDFLIPDTQNNPSITDPPTNSSFSDTLTNTSVPDAPPHLSFSTTQTSTIMSDTINTAPVSDTNSAIKSFCEVEELIEQLHSDEPFKVDEKIQPDETKSECSSPPSVKNGSVNDETLLTESSEGIGELNNRCKEVLRSYNGVRKDNKEDLGRGLEFIDRNLMNMNFRVSDTEYVIKECQLNFSRVKKGVREDYNEESGTIVITKDKVQCDDERIHKFLQEGLRSYRVRLMKELNTEREIEYVSVGSPSPSESSKTVSKPPIMETVVEPPHQAPALAPGNGKLLQVAVQELPSHLVKQIQYRSRGPNNQTALSDSDSVENPTPTINGMKTVPLKIPPSNKIAGHLFVSLQVQSNFLYYYSKEKTLDQILAATNSSPTSLASALLASETVRLGPPSNSSVHSGSSVISTSPGNKKPNSVSTPNRNSSKKDTLSLMDSPILGRTPEKKKIASRFDEYEDNNGYKNRGHVCECWCSKVIQKERVEAQPEVEETREIKTINIMVDCDDCGKTFKDGTNHKCSKKKGNRSEEKVLVCEICQRTFSRQAHLSNHMRSHKDYLKATVKCELCNRRFQKKGEFAKHKAECHPETVKEYSCDECGQLFQTQKKLTMHKRTHEAESDSEMDVRCVHCNGSYPVHYYRTRHLKECTENNPQNNNSRTNGSIEVTMRKPVAIRSGPLLHDDSDSSEDDYMEVQMLEEHCVKLNKNTGTDSEESIMLPKYKAPMTKKRRFMNLDAPSTDSEADEPPRKYSALRSRLRGTSSGEESEYIGEEEIYYMEEDEEEDEDYGRNNVDVEDMADYESA